MMAASRNSERKEDSMRSRRFPEAFENVRDEMRLFGDVDGGASRWKRARKGQIP